jgi:cellulose synthase/poly-beta-1,6-N-acetylglucosamine synthase-like glycosyltransferase
MINRLENAMKECSTTESELLRIAIVPIGRNEGDRLRRCLQSIQAMNYPPSQVEVIYVDSQSSDDSVALAKSMGVRTVVIDGPTTAARGRNAGWTHTEAPFVLFLDGDTILHPDFARRAMVEMSDPKVAGVCGDRREMDTEGSLYNAVFDVDWGEHYGPTLYFGGDALVRTEALRAVGGYNPDLIAGEEPDMCRRMRELGYRILHINAPMTLHDLAMHRFRQYWRRSLRTGWAYAEVSSIYARTSDPLWKTQSLHNLKHGLLWMLLAPSSIAASIGLHSWLPLIAFAALLLLQMSRPAWRVRRKAKSLSQAIAYGIHSELQHVPLLFGQMRYWMRERSQQKAGIIEYKS